MSEELKKEWEEKFSEFMQTLHDCDERVFKNEIADWWLEKLAKQQEEFVKIVENKKIVFDPTENEARIYNTRNRLLDDLLADIKSKLNI
jgi:hypothetical protein